MKLLSLKLRLLTSRILLVDGILPVVPCDHAYKYVLCAVVQVQRRGFALQCFHYICRGKVLIISVNKVEARFNSIHDMRKYGGSVNI